MTNNVYSTRYFSSKQEKTVAKNLGGKVNANSGATMFSKGDVRFDNVLLECKTCEKDKKSFAIKEEWLTKLREESIMMRKDYYSLAFQFGPGQHNFYIIPEFMMQELLEHLK